MSILKIAVVALVGLMPGVAKAATFNGEFWNAPGSLGNLAAALNVVAAGPAQATFTSTAIDYPQGAANNISSNTQLSAFLGTDAASLSGFGTSPLATSVMRFTGYLNLLPGVQTFSVGSDDGFRLTIGGTVISSANNRGFATTNTSANPGSGITAFELIYYENGGSTGVAFSINGALAAPVDAPVIAPVPLPASLPMIFAALGGLALVARRSHKV